MPRALPQRGVRAVLFDLVGTLTTAVSAAQRNVAHERVALALGVPPEAYLNVLLDSYFDRASGLRGSMEQTMRWVAHTVGGHPTDRQLARACALRQAAERAHLRPRPDAARVLATLRARGVRTAVVSDCTHEVPAAWPTFPLFPHVDAAVFSIEVGACKPDLAMYHAACRRLEVAPQDCLYVGDGGSRELSGARAAGMLALRLVAPDSDRHVAMLSERGWNGTVISALGDVLPIVEATDLAAAPTGAEVAGQVATHSADAASTTAAAAGRCGNRAACRTPIPAPRRPRFEASQPLALRPS